MGVRAWALVCVSLVLAACAGSASAAADDAKRAQLEAAAGVGRGELVLYAPASFASAYGGRLNVDFVSGVFAQSAGRIHLLSYDRVTKSFRQDMSFETGAIPGVALVTGPMGRKQLQIQTEGGVVACDFGKILSDGRLAAQVYERLIAAGVRPFESPGWVQAVVVPGPVVIPVYIPSR